MFLEKNKGCDVILVSPMERRWGIYLPFALLYLSSYLESQAISTKIIDLKIRYEGSIRRILDKRFKKEDKNFGTKYLSHILEEINKNRPILIGLTCYTAEYKLTMELAGRIKEKVNIPIVIGGVHATLRPQEFIFSGSPVDFAVVGEGENPLLQLVLALKNKYSFNQIEGIAYLKNTEMAICGTCNVEKDISQFPMPDYDKVDMNFYAQPRVGHVRNLLLSAVEIITSRGCPYNCIFCAVNYLRSKNKEISKIRYRSINQIIEEIELLNKKYKIDGFYIIDDCFMISKERTAEFCEKLIAKKLNLVWGAETRVDLINDEKLLKLIKKAGLIQLEFGVESGSPAMLKDINKGITLEQIRKAFHLCRKNNIRTFANIMFNLPNETRHDVILTEKLLDDIKPTVLGMALTVPLLDTKIYENYVFPKLRPSEYEIYNKNVYYEIVDERFFLASHDLNFKKLLARLNLRHNKLQSISLKPIYLRKILGSYYLPKYLITILRKKLDRVVSLTINWILFFLNNFRKIIKSLLHQQKK